MPNDSVKHSERDMGHEPHRVLLVDDDAGIRESLKELLELEGFAVDTAEHGREGLQRMAQPEVPCLVLLDLMMPVMNGVEFLKALRQDADPRIARTPVTVVSALDEAREVRERFQCEVLRKPVDLDALLRAVHRHCDC
jgi:CheY-like chemotaxis protein